VTIVATPLPAIRSNLQSFAQAILNFPRTSTAAPPPPITAPLTDLAADVAANKAALTQAALGSYDNVGRFITALLPYGTEVVYFPNVSAPDEARRSPAALLEDRGIQVAGLHRAKHSADAVSSSSAEMTVMEERECFYWDFRFPDDPALTASETGDMLNLQITKAMRIPFVYRRPSDGKLLTAAVVVGFEGSGDG
jgi:hypothetical protein